MKTSSVQFETLIILEVGHSWELTNHVINFVLVSKMTRKKFELFWTLQTLWNEM